MDTEIGDPRSTVLKALEEMAPCETGYPGVSLCMDCPGCRGCAEDLDRTLTDRYPTHEWAPTIREVLGMW